MRGGDEVCREVWGDFLNPILSNSASESLRRRQRLPLKDWTNVLVLECSKTLKWSNLGLCWKYTAKLAKT